VNQRVSSLLRITGIRNKIKRAKKHISDLDVAIRSFCDKEPYTLGIREHAEIAQVALYIESVESVPDCIQLAIGDAVHNLRSALDHLMWQLVEAGGGTPNNETQFPICVDPNGAQKYASAIGQGELQRIPIGADKVLLAVQPFQTKYNTLWHLHQLDIVDRHRLFLTAITIMSDWRIVVQPGSQIKFNVAGQPLVNGYELVRVPIGSYYHKHAREGCIKLGLDLTFGQFEIVAGKPVLETLNHMADLVDGIVASFAPFLV
jgi:hypothetical protein